ncbi:hypothetical protein EDD65_10349 [Keratinibaculum paraultunense]|uniref:BPL/LPL catalytic domain-containing protein n=1 Tax=Keratinibaculum paraultunense TaxID=1278232 RepID=A0A4R3L2J5_9FIRM|nr:hypothetical protein EDD65_10349 [Keratinibaculum paraultunense]
MPTEILHHGTLLYNCDIEKLSSALKNKNIKFVDKSIKSISSRVTNIAPYMKNKMTTQEFKNYLKTYIIKTYNIEKIYKFNNKDIENINKISKKNLKLGNGTMAKVQIINTKIQLNILVE